MMTNKRVRFFMLFMIIAVCLISSVSAEVINETTIQVHDFTDESVGYSQTRSSGSNTASIDTFLCYNIESSGGLQRIIFNAEVDSYSRTKSLDQYGTIDITLASGSTVLGNGIMEYERTDYNSVTKLYNKISCSIEIYNYDVSGYTGELKIKFYETGHNNPEFIGKTLSIGRPADLGDGGFYLSLSNGGYPSASYSIQIDRKEDFYQHLTYSVDENNNIATAYYRENQLNVISLRSDDNVYYYNAEESTDIPTIVMVNKTYAEYKIWLPLSLEIKTIRIPEGIVSPTDPTEPIEGTTTLEYHIYDGAREYKDLTCDYVITQENEGVYTAYESGTAYGGYLVQNYDNGYKYKIHFEKDGYVDSQGNEVFAIDYAYNIEEVAKIISHTTDIRLFEDYGDNITLSFSVEDLTTNEKLSGATVTLNTETKTTDSAGYAIFNNISKTDYTYTISKPGYESYTDSWYYDYSILIKVALHKKSEAYLTYSFYDAITGGYLSVNYDIFQKRNGIFQPYLINNYALGGTFAKALEVGWDYRLDISADNYKNEQILLSPFIEDVRGTMTLYPLVENESELFSTIIFDVKDSDGKALYGVRVSGFGGDRYTDKTGKTSFYWSNELIVTYSLYKDGYQKVIGTEDIKEDKILYFILYEDGESPIPTEKPSEEIPQPTNIIESIQYALSKMFGFETSTTEGIKNTNYALALIIIAGFTGIVASVTKDGLGALIGATIGFLISVGFGLLPLWLLFTSVGLIGIFIILFKTKGE